jgi:hypothetical protein
MYYDYAAGRIRRARDPLAGCPSHRPAGARVHAHCTRGRRQRGAIGNENDKELFTP